MRPLAMAALLVILAVPVARATPEGIPITYMDPRGREPMTTFQRLDAAPLRGPYSRTVLHSAALFGTDTDLVVLLVEEAISDDLATSLATYVSDLEAEGYAVETWLISGGDATDIRSDLQTSYAGGDLVGAVCIGDIPTGWIDGGYGEYPVDLYLMDMNGTWNDSDSDGLFESNSGEAPEIWIGRLTPTYISSGGAAELLNDYFARNHAYRMGTLSLPDRALAYEEAFTGLTGYLDLLYDTVVRKTSPAGTNADDFRQELLTGYEWVHLISHSSPWGSSFHTGAPPAGAGTLDNFEIPPLDPHAFFYVLNCCSNGRWTEVDNLANSYIWCDTYGLAVLAQTKVDYTNDFQEYYQVLATGGNLGDAFQTWLASNLSLEDGAVLLGDPTLVPRQGNMGVSSLPGGGSPASDGTWLTLQLTDGLHSQGRMDVYADPSTGEVFAVCGTSDPVRANILATSSSGDTWAQPMIVCEHEYWDWHPTVGGDGQGKVWTAWQSMDNNHEGYDIYLSEWNGSSWTGETILTTGDPYEVEPAMTGGGGKAWLVWQKWDGTSTDIEGVFWTGSQWSTPALVTDDEGREQYPDIARSSDGFGLVYHARRGGDWAICFRDAPDSGPFGTETVISQAGESSRYACITSSGSEYWVVWQTDTGDIASSHGAGSSWSAPETISGGGHCVRPFVAWGNGEATAVWSSGTGSLEVSSNSGSGWTPSETIVTADAIDDAALAWAPGGKLWAVYGSRGTDLQWDLWAGTPDLTGIEEGSSPIPSDLGISVTGENPFHGSVSFELSAPGLCELRIFDLAGRILLEENVISGGFVWNAVSGSGKAVQPGLYFAVISDGIEMESCRLIRLP